MRREDTALTLIAAGVFALTVLLYWPSLRNGLLQWDDNIYLQQAQRLGTISTATVRWAFTATQPFYYHPLTWLAQVLNWQLWHSQPAGFHAVNLGLHSLNAALVVI